MNSNPYLSMVEAFTSVYQLGKRLPLGGISLPKRVVVASDAPRVLLFSPHPDDECIVGGLALRFLRELGWHVVNVVVTRGSKRGRRFERFGELQGACGFLQFEVEAIDPEGFNDITKKGRADTQNWPGKVQIIRGILEKYQPRVIFFPHLEDWNGTHVGTHLLLRDALDWMTSGFRCHVVETEFWGQMQTPNLMVESAPGDVADLMAACSFHVGEVRRNPYHLNQISWMQDNVRRGAELVGGQGGVSPDFLFATLYRHSLWANGRLVEAPVGRGIIPVSANLSEWFL